MSRRGCRVGCLGALLALIMAGCGDRGGNLEPAAGSGAQAAEPAKEFPVTIQNCGHALSFDKPPSRVVPGYQPVLETLIELGVADRIVGRPHFDENAGAPDEFLPGHKAVYDSIPEISKDPFIPKREELLARSPDFVLDVSPGSFKAETGYATIEELAAAGAQVFIAGNWCSEKDRQEFRLENTLSDIVDLGRIFGVEERAAEVVDDLRRRMDTIRRAVAGQRPLRVIFADPTGDAFFAMGQGLGDELAEAAGVENALHDAGDYAEVSVEEVARANADAYVIIQYLPITAGQRIAAIEQIAPNSPGVRDRRYVVIPAVAIHPGYRNFVAAETIARALYPGAFKQPAPAG